MLPVYTNDQIANYLTNGFATNQGYTQTHWNVSTGGTMTVNISALAATGQFFATAAMKTWSEITGINFTFTTGVAKISFFDDGTSSAYETDSSIGGFTTSAAIHISQDWIASDIGKLNSYSYQTYLHEIGHALGLGHAGNYNGNATYDLNLGTAGHNQYVNDSWQTSIMSYFSQTENTYLNPVGGSSTAGFAFVMTPMAADILAVQSYYGISTTAHTGNTVYGFHSTAGNAIFDATQITGASYTIEDSNGIDTMDYSGYAMNQKISLVAESFSDIGGVKGSVTIARGTVIENAIGGSGNDIIIGNAADNILKGGAGNDTLDGGAGNDTADYSDKITSVVVTMNGATAATVTVNGIIEDTIKNIENLIGGSGNDILTGDNLANILNGGTGADTLNGGSGNDTYIIDNVGDTIVELSSGGTDTAQSSITYTLANDVENLTLTNSANIEGTGNALNNVIQGNIGNNVLDGGMGDDTFVSSGGVDYMFGGSGTDTVSYASSAAAVQVNLGAYGTGSGNSWDGTSMNFLTSIENVVGSTQGDTLRGDVNDNVFQGNGGLDSINGGGGNDTVSYVGSTTGVQVNLGAYGTGSGNSWDGTSMNFLTSIENVIGSTHDDILTGDANNNVVNGGLGNDTLTGGLGADAFRFVDLNFGTKYVTDYLHSTDYLSFSAAVFHLFSDFTITNNDSLDVIVKFAGGGTIVLHNTVANHVDATDFLFV